VKRVKKIVFFAMNLGGGGAERVLVDLSNLLESKYSKEYSITVCTIFSGALDNQLNNRINFVRLFNRDFSKRRSIVNKIFFRILCLGKGKVLRKLIDFKLKEKFDLEIAFLEGFPAKMVSISENKNTRKIGWIHANLKKLDYTAKFFNSTEHEVATYNELDQLVFVSDECSKGYISAFGEGHRRTQVIKNIVNYDRINRLAQEKNIFEFPYICSIGRLSDEKGFDRLIEAYRNLKLQKKIVNLKLIIVGSGKKEKELKNLIKEYNLQDDVILIPFSENPYKILSNCEFFISSSRTEGYPLVVVEALVLKKPVMVTETGAATVVGEGEYGLVVENSTRGIERGIVELLNEKSKFHEKATKGSIRVKAENEEKMNEIVSLFNNCSK